MPDLGATQARTIKLRHSVGRRGDGKRSARDIDIGRSRRGSECWLCGERMLDEASHKAECRVRQRKAAERRCGTCNQAITPESPLNRKYHPGQCAETAKSQWARRSGVWARAWPANRIQPIVQLLQDGIHASYVAAEAGLTSNTLSEYAKSWRRRGFLSKRLLIDTRDLKAWGPKRNVWTPLATHYPYINASPTTEHDLVLFVDRAVPKSIPESLRADVCQQILLDILEGHLMPENIQEEIPDILKAMRRELMPYQERSIETMMPDADGATWLERRAVPFDPEAPESAHQALSCDICRRPVYRGAVADHAVCEVISGEMRRQTLSKAKGRWGSTDSDTPLGLVMRAWNDPSRQAQYDLIDMRARKLRAAARVVDCIVCGFPLPDGHPIDHHDGCAVERREREEDTYKSRFHELLPGRKPLAYRNRPVPGAFGKSR